MFDRFSDNSRQCMSFARQAAEDRDHDYIGTEHILIGLLRQPDCRGTRILLKLGANIESLTAAIEQSTPRGEKPIAIRQLPFTPRAKRTLECAIEEARALNQDYVGTEHVLLGLLVEGEGLAAKTLLAAGITADMARAAYLSDLGGGAPPQRPGSKLGDPQAVRFAPRERPESHSEQPSGAEMFDGATSRFRFALNLATREAWRFGQDEIGAEHLLLGLIHEGSGVAVRVLEVLGVDLDRLKSSVECVAARESRPPRTGKLPYSRRARNAFDSALSEARLLKHTHFGTEHLLLGLLHVHGPIEVVLSDLGVTLSRVREAVVDFVRDCPEKVKRFHIDTSSTHIDLNVKSAIQVAYSESRAEGKDVVLLEHLLLGILGVKDTLAEKLLQKHGLTLDAVRAELRRMRGENTN